MNDNRPEIVAHRAGNHPDQVGRAMGRADVIEIDVHVRRGRVEARHEKVLWPTSRLWERWFLLPRGTTSPTLTEAVEAIGPEIPLMLDLKCFTRRAARRIRRAVAEDRPLIVSSRTWWVLGAFRSRPGTVMLRSCGSHRQLWLAMRLTGLGHRVGIVAHQRVLDDRTVESIRSKTPAVYTWAVQSVERAARLTTAGVTGLIVDDLSLPWPGLDPLPDLDER